MIEKTVKTGDLLILHTGFHRYSQFGAADEERYIHMHPGAHPSMVPWLLRKGIHIWGVDCVSTDHPMNSIGRFLGKACTITGPGCGRPPRPSSAARRRWTKCSPIPPTSLTHNALFPKDCMHIENMGGEIDAPELQNKRCIIGCFPWKFRGGEAAFCRAVAWLGEWPKNP